MKNVSKKDLSRKKSEASKSDLVKKEGGEASDSEGEAATDDTVTCGVCFEGVEATEGSRKDRIFSPCCGGAFHINCVRR